MINLTHSVISTFKHLAVVVALITASLFTTGCAETIPEGAIRVMSYNLRYANSDLDGFNARKKLLADSVIIAGVDVLAIQEGDEPWMDELPGLLPEYSYVGVGRDDGAEAGEFSAIFYLADKFEVLDSGTFWLSPTPEIPSFGWGANNRRICTWAVLRNIETGETYTHYNTHLDHESQLARVNGTSLILDHMNTSNYPVVLTGDLNTPEGSDLYQTIEDTILADTKHTAELTKSHGTINWFFPVDTGIVIDFVFAQEDAFLVHRYDVITFYEVNEKPVSDHYPVYADLTFL